MPNKDDNKKLISVIEENSSDWLEQVPAVLGDLSGNVSAGGSLVYARLDNGYPIIAVNYIAPLIFDLHVLVGRNKSQPGFFQVISVREAYVNPQSEFVKYHHEQHEYDDVSPGPDIAWIRRKQFLPFTVLVKDPVGFIVQVYGNVFLGASGFAMVDNQEVDVSSYVPTSGALFVVIETNDSGVLSINEGDGFGSPELSAIDNIPTPAVGKYPLAAVLLFESQPELLNSNILVLFPMSSNPGNFQPLDEELSEIAALQPKENDLLQYVDGKWKNIHPTKINLHLDFAIARAAKSNPSKIYMNTNFI